MQIIHRVTVMQVLTEQSKEKLLASFAEKSKRLNENAASSIFSLENMKKISRIPMWRNLLKKPLKRDKTKSK